MHRHPVRKQDQPQVLSPDLGNLGPEPEPPVFLFLLMLRILHHFSNPLFRDGRAVRPLAYHPKIVGRR